MYCDIHILKKNEVAALVALKQPAVLRFCKLQDSPDLEVRYYNTSWVQPQAAPYAVDSFHSHYYHNDKGN